MNKYMTLEMLFDNFMMQNRLNVFYYVLFFFIGIILSVTLIMLLTLPGTEKKE